MSALTQAGPPGVDDAATPTTFEGRAMGSPLRLTLAGGAAAAWSAVVDEFEAAEVALSRFRDDSELTALNRRAGTGEAVRVAPRLRRALVAADRARRISDGRFDPRVLTDLDRLGYRGASLAAVEGRVPDGRERRLGSTRAGRAGRRTLRS